MANAAFSPKDFKAWIIKEATPGTAPTYTSGLHQLDVDSVSFPSLNVNQVTAVRTQAGRILDKGDFFQDSVYKTTEVSLSGTFHPDAGHVQLMQSVTGNTLATSVADVALGYAATGISGKYGVAQADATFTLVLASPDTTDGYNIVMTGCMVTNFSISADMGTEGGLYKWSATISTGFQPTLDSEVDEDGTAYTGGVISLANLGTPSIYSITTTVLNSFSITIDAPAVYAGTSSNGYAAFARGAELSVTGAAQVKYDAATRGLIKDFGETGAVDVAGAFDIPQSTATKCSIGMSTAVLTNVALSEGDIMMIDVELKAVSNGSGNVLHFDLA